MPMRLDAGSACRAVFACSLAILPIVIWVIVLKAHGQALTGAVAGRVVDAQGAVVPNAEITVRNTDVAAARIFEAAADGTFRVTGLISGAYTVEGQSN